MWLFTFTAARTALTYITLGVLTVIWTGVWYVYMYNNPPAVHSSYYWCIGFLVTGLALVGIGTVLSFMHRPAQPVDLPAALVPMAVVNAPPIAMAPAPVLAPDSTPPVVVSNGQLVAATPEELSPR